MDEQNKTVQPEAAAAPESRPLKKPASAKDEAPRRRVGNFTLGISLIAEGILFLCYYFVPGFDWQLALKIAPAAGLILLGGEVLFFAARPPGALEVRFLVGADLPCAHGRVLWPFAAAGGVG